MYAYQNSANFKIFFLTNPKFRIIIVKGLMLSVWVNFVCTKTTIRLAKLIPYTRKAAVGQSLSN